MSASSDLSLDVSQIIDARPETVYRLLVEPDLYGLWFGPPGATVTVAEMNVVLGGRLELRISFPGSDHGATIEGFYEVIEPAIRIVHTWRLTHEELVTTVQFELEPRGDGTLLQVHHKGFVDPFDLGQNQAGWSDHLDAMRPIATALEAPKS